MKVPLNLRRPSNWQDFENLCKKLWGEIWKCPEIQKNGRLGQEQSGVDIFGIPTNEIGYYGIQCKGKNEYTHNQFTEGEIILEVSRAKTFQPPLRKLYLATTASNDSKIQAFVRKVNMENMANGFFEVHIFCWETIVDLIDENEQTHDWYIKSQNYKTEKSVTVTFEDGSTEIEYQPKFKKKGKYFRLEAPEVQNPYLSNGLIEMMRQQQKWSELFNTSRALMPTINLSYFSTTLLIKNTGTLPLEDYKLLLSFDGNFQDITDDSSEQTGILTAINPHVITDVYLEPEAKRGKIVPRRGISGRNILVGDDSYLSDEIFIKPFPEKSDLIISWKLISKNYKTNGSLKITISPQIHRDYEEIIVDQLSLVRLEEGEIVDFITEKTK